MFSIFSFRDWILQVIHTVMLKFFSWYDFVFTPISTTTEIIIPNEIITDILLRLPTKSLLKCMSVSKSWHRLISSPDFVKNHLKLNTHQLLLFPGINEKYKFCSLPPLFNQQQELLSLHNIDPPTLKAFFVASVNGLICLCTHEEMYIWNPTIRKSKKLRFDPKWGKVTTPSRFSVNIQHGFGYDESTDNYKAVIVTYYLISDNDELSIMSTVVNIYNLRSGSWTTLDDQLQGIFLITCSGKFVNGKIYWAASNRIGNYNMCNIISFDVADETWGRLELPISGDDNSKFKLGVVRTDLSVLHTCHFGTTTSDVWVLKDWSDISWMKLFTIEYHQYVVQYLFSSPMIAFSIHLCQSEKADILLSLPDLIMIFDGATKKLEHTTDVDGYNPAETYAESVVNPLTISGEAVDDGLLAEHQEIQEESTEEEEYETEEDEETEEEYETEEHEETKEEYEAEEQWRSQDSRLGCSYFLDEGW